MNGNRTMFAALAFFVATAGAHGEPLSADSTRSLAATCAACHGTEGRAIDGSAMVPLAGYPKAALASRLREFRDGTRDATVMHQIARGYDDAQVDALAAWFASRPARAR